MIVEQAYQKTWEKHPIGADFLREILATYEAARLAALPQDRVERVARALFHLRHETNDKNDSWQFWRMYEDDAKAALAAMQPTKAPEQGGA